MKKFILASQSPRRRTLLRQSGFRFQVIPSKAKETYPSGLKPHQIVVHLARKKAKEVAKAHPGSIVVGADTLVFLKKRVLGKPKNLRHAQRMLQALSNRWQKVFTGVCVTWEGGRKSKTGYAVSRVKIRALTNKEIEKAARQHLDKAGAYAIQQKKDPFVKKLEGSYDNVVGLPMKVVRKLLRLAR